MRSNAEMGLGVGGFNRHVGKRIDAVKDVPLYMEEMVLVKKNQKGVILLKFCDKKKLCAANTYIEKIE